MGKRRPGMTEEEIAKARRRSRRCYWRNRDQILERERQCRKDNAAAQIRKRTREYCWANRERILDRARGYRDEHARDPEWLERRRQREHRYQLAGGEAFER